jgi:cell division inhibitor SulA
MHQPSLSVDQQPKATLSRRASLPPAPRSRAVPTRANTGSLTEVIVAAAGAIQPLHLLPMLAQCNAQQRWLMWLSPHRRRMNKHWLESMNLQQAPVLHLDLSPDTQLALCCKILESGNSHMIVEWQGSLTSAEREQIRLSARTSGSHLVLIQHENSFNA